MIENPELYYKRPEQKLYYSDQTGYFSIKSAELIGKTGVLLGAGRIKKEDDIDYTAGIVFNKNHGDHVKKGDLLFTMYSENAEKLDSSLPVLQEAFALTTEEPAKESLILEIIR